MFGHFQTASIFKQTASNLKIWELRHWEVIKFVDQNHIKSVLDIGCNEGKLLQKLQRGIQAQKLVGIDIDSSILQIARSNLFPEPIQRNLMMERQKNQSVQLYHGSALDQYKQLKQMNFQLVTLIQVIQHLHLQQLNDLSQNIFKFINPEFVIISTPNKDFNCFFGWQSDKVMRHQDHKFQWTRKEFQDYVKQVSNKYHYQYKIYGIGQHVNDNSKGFCTQMALFQRKLCINGPKQINQEHNNKLQLRLICQYTNQCWKSCQQELVKQAIYNSLIFLSDRVEWEQGINYLRKARIFKVLSGNLQLQQSFSNIKAVQQYSIVTKQYLIDVFKNMKGTIFYDEYGYERNRQAIQQQFSQDWHDIQEIQNIAQNYQTPNLYSPFMDSNNSRSISDGQQGYFSNELQFSSSSRRNDNISILNNFSNSKEQHQKSIQYSINQDQQSILLNNQTKQDQFQFTKRRVKYYNSNYQEQNQDSSDQWDC